jgi:4-aminobutyrate aminotransferase
LVIRYGEGSVVEDVDGNRYIDLNAGIAVLSTGHRNPIVIEAIKKQLDRFLHYSLTDFYYEEAVALAEKLIDIMPGDKVFFTNSGAESIEGAIKIARGYYKGKRPYIVSFIGSFHGRTMGAMSLTASKTIHRKYFSPLMPGVIHVPYPYCFRCVFNLKYPDCALACLDFIDKWIFRKVVSPDEVAAIFIEPIQGEGGYVPAPREFMRELRELTYEHGILLVADEVQCGMGRTGKWLAVQNYKINPDIITLAKGIASGLPLGAIVGREDVMSLEPGAHANTFGGNPISIAASLATIDLLENSLLENAAIQGEYLLGKLSRLMERYDYIGDVRGLGLMIGMELVRSKKNKEPAKDILNKVIEGAFKRGVLVIGAGESTIRFSPPLNITREEIDEALNILEEVIEEAIKISF